MFSIGLALLVVQAAHVRVTCDVCGTSAELCGKRELAMIVRLRLVAKFQELGWHHDPGLHHTRARTEEEVKRTGAGKWYCPKCAAKTHL